MKLLFAFLLVGYLSISTATSQINVTETFSTNTSGSWAAFDVAGMTDIWGFGSGYASINGFGDQDDEDWLISPSFNMNNSTAESLSFNYRNRFNGAEPSFSLKLFYTTSYTGKPSDAANQWTEIAMTPTYNNTSTASTSFTAYPPINISAIAGADVRFAFKYFGTSALAKEWQLDDILIAGVIPCVAPITQPSALATIPSNTSAVVSWAKGDGTNTLVLINNTNSFTDPLDGTAYSANTTYTGSGQQVVYNGVGTNAKITGLVINTTYYLKAYNFNNCGLITTIDYIIAIAPTSNFITTAITSGEPTGYYTTANGLTCVAKRNALSTIITTGYADNGYGGLWTTYNTSDLKPNSNKIWCIYTDIPNGSDCDLVYATDQDNGTGGNVECDKYNREHTVPQSWFSENAPLVSDAFHILPTDKKVNNVRGNQPYGEVGSASYTSRNGSKYGISSIQGISGEVFEPIDEYKGDIARIYFYMATRYGAAIGSANTPESDIVLDDTNFPTFKPLFLKMLLRWHNLDTVSKKEIDRNNAIYNRQNNRNPYVDHPEYVAQVWGGSCAGINPTVDNFNEDKVTFIMYPNPSHDIVTIKFDKPTQTNISINVIDMLGRVSLRQNFDNSSELTFNINSLPIGNYIIQLSANGAVSHQRMVVRQ
jgi:endonuclease I